MTDKEKIIKELKEALDSLDITNKYRLNLIRAIEYLQDEPVSDELEIAANEWDAKALFTPFYMTLDDNGKPNGVRQDYTTHAESFKAGAKWQKENLWKPADGDDLPEYDKEVIAILDYDFGHYKVVYAHRPNPNGWNGTNIDTGEKEHFEPEIYDKGGWNQPHVLYWLDAKLPYEENKIIKKERNDQGV